GARAVPRAGWEQPAPASSAAPMMLSSPRRVRRSGWAARPGSCPLMLTRLLLLPAGLRHDEMGVAMRLPAGRPPPPTCLTILLLELLAAASQGLLGGGPPAFHFTQPLYNATVHENSAARTYVSSPGRMGVALADPSWDIKYRVVSGDEEGLFKAEEVVLADFCFLRIRTKGGNAAVLNREVQDHYLLVVRGSVRGEDLEAWTKVSIQVLDMNDLRPLFSPTTYSVTVAESTPLRTSVAQVTATDADIGSNGAFYYYFKDRVDLFSVHPTSGVVSLSGRLNYDEKNRHDLEVLAVDRGMKLYGSNGVSSTARLHVHVERVNAHAPSLRAAALAPSPRDAEPSYALVTAEDPDEGANGEVESVSIVAGDPLGQFLLARDETWTGTYRLRQRRPVDWTSCPLGCNLTLQARDRGSPPRLSAALVLHVPNPHRDAAPVRFERERYEASVSEFAPPGTVVALVRLRPEPPGAEYRLSPGKDARRFSINPRSGLIVTAQPLGAPGKDTYQLEVTSRDGALRAQVSVHVEDANDHAPEFQQPLYEASVNESAPVGTGVLAVSATDRDRGENGYITYSIASLGPLPFTINQFTGLVSTTEELDFESCPETYRFVVRASDWGAPYRHESEANVTVRVRNANDNRPLFEKVACQGAVAQDFPVGGHVTAVSAIDVDELELVKYQILSGNELGFFYLNPDSGVLQLKKPLADASAGDAHFTLRITATDGEHFADPMSVNISVLQGKAPSKSFSCRETRVAQRLAEKLLAKAKASGRLHQGDGFLDSYVVNRQAPRFDASLPSDVAVREDLPVGATVLRVRASDPDAGFSGKVLFTIAGGNTDSCFSIDMDTGQLTVLLPLDRERTDRYLLNISVYDLGTPQRAAWRLLAVHVEDANDNSPVFLQDSYSVSVLESTAIGTEIVQLEARDRDWGANGEVTYAVLTDTRHFAINSSTGIVYVADQLDRETRASYSLRVEARDRAAGGQQLSAAVTLQVLLGDVNDCAPAFVPSSQGVKVPEDLPVGTVIAWLETQDPDLGLGGQVRYSLANDYGGRFEVDRASGAVRLSRELDYEKQQFYNLTVRAKDKGRPVSLSSVSFVEVEVVDVNENLHAPRFPDFAVAGSVRENARVGTRVLQVAARDEDPGRDGEVQYSLRDGSGLGRFSIDEDSGECGAGRARGGASAGRGEHGARWGECGVGRGERGAGPGQGPAGPRWTSPVPTGMSVCSACATSEAGRGLTQALCGRREASGALVPHALQPAHAGLRGQRGTCGLYKKWTLRFNVSRGVLQKPFEMWGRPRVPVAPASWPENLGAPCPGPPHGAPSTSAQDTARPWSATPGTVLVSRVSAETGRGRALSRPYLPPQVGLSERARCGSQKTLGAGAGGPASLRSALAGRADALSPAGVISTAEVLDRETAGAYWLTVHAADRGVAPLHSSIEVYVEVEDENDNAPLTSEPLYRPAVLENSPRDTPVVQIQAEDPDPSSSGRLTYRIASGNPQNFFAINAKTGTGHASCCRCPGRPSALRLGAAVAVLACVWPPLQPRAGREARPGEAQGPEGPARQHHCPAWGPDLHDRAEAGPGAAGRALPGGHVHAGHMRAGHVHMQATRTQATRAHRPSPALPRGVAMPRHSPGSLPTARPSPQVTVTDGGPTPRQSSVWVSVRVLDENDNRPQFPEKVYQVRLPERERRKRAEPVYRAFAFDRDEGPNAELAYSIVDGNEDGRFFIDPKTGLVSSRRHFAAGTYDILTIKAVDNGRPQKASTARLHIEWVKRPPPSPVALAFEEPFYNFTAMESDSVADVVGVVAAQPAGSPLWFDIVAGNSDSSFDVGKGAGTIVIAKPLDAELRSVYNMTVEVTDGTSVAVTQVLVRVLDSNDNGPEFSQPHYDVTLSEDVLPDTEILRLEASDRDEQHTLTFSLHSSLDAGSLRKFRVDPSSGVLSTIERLDHEAQDRHLLNVMVGPRRLRDARARGQPVPAGRPPRPQLSGACVCVQVRDQEFPYRRSLARVTVHVEDANDHSPRFPRPLYEASALESAAPGSAVLQVTALDRDRGENAELVYSIEAGAGGVPMARQESAPPLRSRLFWDGDGASRAGAAGAATWPLPTGRVCTRAAGPWGCPGPRGEGQAQARGTAQPGPQSIQRGGAGPQAVPAPPGVRASLGRCGQGRDGLRGWRVRAGGRRCRPGRHARKRVPLGTSSAGWVPPRGPSWTPADVRRGGRSGPGTFKIEPVLGIITVSRELDMTAAGQFVLSVRATDRGSPPMSATTIVRVSVTLSDNARPRFVPGDYQAEVAEGVDVGTSVVLVSAASQSTLVYELKAGNADGAFGINPYSGVVTTRRGLDFERMAAYQLTVQATNMAGMAANTTVSVQVLDENDNAPVFLCTHYAGRVSEAAPAGSVVRGLDGRPLLVRASDADSARNALLEYQILEPAARAFFAVDASTGAIRTAAGLDHERAAHFLFHVHVWDSGSPKLAAESPAEVSVEVADVNDNPPAFTQAAFEAVLLLPTYVGVEVLTVSATDPDSEVPLELTYSLAEGGAGHFQMDARSGVLTVSNSSLPGGRYMLPVRVSDGMFLGTSTVTVLVREALDSGLRFTQSLYSASVPENSPNVSHVAVVSAVGSRLNEPLRYSILNPGGRFSIAPAAGVVRTAGVALDREEQACYELVVEASRELDPLRVARAVVRVSVEDANDNAPVFVGLPYYAAVQVDAVPGTLVHRVTAVDRDQGANGAVTYALQDGYGHFQIDPRSGDVLLKEAFSADLSSTEYGVTVLARDGGEPALATSVELPITVVNKAMPVFDRPFYAAALDEDVGPGTPVLSLNASSPEGQGPVYVLLDGDPLGQFSVGFDTGVLTVAGALDYEATPAYRLTVRASDALTGARAEVAVDVLLRDVNDNPPVFAQPAYNATLSEAALVGTPVLQLAASDADSGHNRRVHYQIVQASHNGSDHFHVDGSSGLILTARALDHEALPRCTLRVRAADSGFPPLSSEALVHVHITDVNDNPPVFSQLVYEAYVSELAPRGHFVTRVQASDADSSDAGRLEYSILSGSDRAGFLMDGQSGVLSLSGHRRQRTEPLSSLNVSVSDGLFTSTAQVHVRVFGANLHSPAFAQSTYVAEVRENAAAGTRVAHARAADGDPGLYGQVSYAILNDFARDRFVVDGSGQVATTERLDRENPLEADISVFLRALDGGGRAAFCAVRVIVLDENDNAPQFAAVEYRASVRADVGSGHLVTQVQAADPDAGANGRLTYSLYSEASVSVADLLEMDADSGWLVTKGSFQQLRGSVLSFFVRAVDGGVPARHSLVPVYVHVLAPEMALPSFPQPQYSFSVPEDTAIGSALGTLRVLPGRGARFSTVNGERPEHNAAGVFVVEPDTGTLKLDKRLDHEADPAFHFKVAATVPQGEVDAVVTVDVDVRVLDLNDNRPVFDSASYEAVVMEGMPAGTRLAQVRAADPDGGANGQVSYTLLADARLAGAAGAFAIDSSTGWISTLRDLDHDTSPTFAFSVVAADLGEAFSLSATAAVSVRVTDINDNAPVFAQDLYRGEVREGDPPGQVVAVLSTWDRDSAEANHQVSYHITGGDPRGSFALGLVQSEWKVHVKKPLDREEQDHYLLNITATDGLFVTQAAVEVTVTDVNDNSPVCDQAAYGASFPEDTGPHKVLLRVSAQDADAGANGQVRYSLHGPGNEDFFLDPDSGELRTLAPLDREQVPEYSLLARATDVGGRSCQAHVHLRLEDVNDNPPTFSADHYEACVYESTAPKALVARVQALDPDLGEWMLLGVAGRFWPSGAAPTKAGMHWLPGLRSLKTTPTPGARHPSADHAGCLPGAGGDNRAGPGTAAPGTDSRSGLQAACCAGWAFAGRSVLARFRTVSAPRSPGPAPLDPLPSIQLAPPRSLLGPCLRCPPQGRTPRVTVGGGRPRGVPAPSPAPPGAGRPLPAGGGSPLTPSPAGANRRVTYSLADSAGGVFSIDGASGLVVLEQPLDRELQPAYSLRVRASDQGPGQGLSSLATLAITVLDVNDNPPVFERRDYLAAVPEDAAPGTQVLTVFAASKDVGTNAEITYLVRSGNEHGKFGVHPRTAPHAAAAPQCTQAPVWIQAGALLGASAPRPRGENPPPQAARLHGGRGRPLGLHTGLTPGAVRWRGPSIELPGACGLCSMQGGHIPEGAGQTAHCGPRGPRQSRLPLSLQGGISVSDALDYESCQKFYLVVEARDGGTPALSAVATVSIDLTDVNDNAPRFSQDVYSAVLSEDAPVGASVILVGAGSVGGPSRAALTRGLQRLRLRVAAGRPRAPRQRDEDGSCGCSTASANGEPDTGRPWGRALRRTVALIAEDADSPPNAQLRFSIAGGDRDGEFAVDPVLGLVKVKKKLDRERVGAGPTHLAPVRPCPPQQGCLRLAAPCLQVSGYSLLVQAVDSGLPTLSATTTVNIDIADVNDNSPVFTPANYSAVIQENKPVGTSVVQLVVADRDSFHNGPPFSFAILAGNEQQAFAMDPQGTLRSAVVFRHAQAPEFLLCIQATDSGRPPQTSRTYVRVRVIEESVHRPTATPLEVFVVTLEDDFPGGVVGRVHAADQDAYDTLTFALTSEQRSLFKVDSRDGRVIALGGLDSGKYVLNVSVSDGRFQVPVDVVVHVEQLAREMLPHTVTLRLEGVSAEDFVGLHLHAFRRALRAALLTQKQDSLRIASIQPAPGERQLDLLFAVERRPRDFYRPAYLIQKLSGARRHLEGAVRIAAILEKNCSGLDCQEQHCEQALSLDAHVLLTYSSARTSFVCPRFHRSARCACNGELCPGADDPCVEKPCPEDMQCVGFEASRRPFLCQCPPGQLGECSGHTSLSFAGNSYIKYRLSEDSREEAFRLALRLRTLQAAGVVMHTRAGACLTLKIVDGKLWFQLDCGAGPGVLGISGRAVNDGRWHWVSLELNRNSTSLSLDDSYVERRRAPLYFQTLRADTAVYFGAQVQADDAGLAEARAAQVLSGFQGCLDAVVLNGHELPLQNKRSSFAEVAGLTELKLGCVLYPDACAHGPCQHGGSCTGLPSGGYQCACRPQFTGHHCEAEITACFPNPCRNGGSCGAAGSAFTCSCRAGLTGLTCEEDVDECAREECENGGACVNVFGSFACNCTRGFVGPRCALRPVLVPDIQAGQAYVGKEELVGVTAVLLVILVLVALFAAFRRKVFRKRYSRNNITLVQDPAAAALLRKSNGVAFRGLRAGERGVYQEVGPPQVPVRPMAYTPCFQSDSRGNLDKAADALGAEHQEMTTFHPESPRILTARRGVVVCSVAPNLPAVSPCRSDCDSIQKNGWDAGPDSERGPGRLPWEAAAAPEWGRGAGTEGLASPARWTFSRKMPPSRAQLGESEAPEAGARQGAWGGARRALGDRPLCPAVHPDKGAEDAGDEQCYTGSNGGSSSEVQSLSSFPSDSGDDNASVVTVIQLVSNVVDTVANEASIMDQGQNYNRAYHWDTSDWMPGARLSNITEAPRYEGPEGAPAAGAVRELDSEYYLGGYDVDSEYPPPPEEDFLSQDQLPPPLPRDGPDQDEALALARPPSPGCCRRPRFHPSQYLPPHPCPRDPPDPAARPFSAFMGSLPGAPEATAPAGGDPLSLHSSRGAWALDTATVSSGCGLDRPGLAAGDREGGDESGRRLPLLETQHQTQV
ncbi:LOW QUALITY PROTEIN: Protocadherin Fat 3, partial [Galemys pyrenaicus]